MYLNSVCPMDFKGNIYVKNLKNGVTQNFATTKFQDGMILGESVKFAKIYVGDSLVGKDTVPTHFVKNFKQKLAEILPSDFVKSLSFPSGKEAYYSYDIKPQKNWNLTFFDNFEINHTL